MKQIALLVIVTFLSLSNSLMAQNGQKTYTLTINGTTYTVKEGEDLQLEGSWKNPVISITSNEFEQFQSENISFEYPSELIYSKEIDDNEPFWTLTGSAIIFSYSETKEVIGIDEFGDGMATELTDMVFKRRKTKMLLGGKQTAGEIILAETGGPVIYLEYYLFPLKEGGTGALILQDTMESDTHSDEYEEAIKVFQTSFKFL